MNSKKLDTKLEALQSNILNTVKIMKDEWTTTAQIQRESAILTSNIAMNIKGTLDNEQGTTWGSTTYNQIQNMMLPSYMSWDYWVVINQWADYWVNRYSEFEHDNKENILTAIRIACLFGISAIDKETGEPYYISGNGNTRKVITSPNALNSTAWSMVNDEETKKTHLHLSDKIKTKEKDIKDLYIFTWRFNNIGDFVWCMKQILTDIYLKKIIECNLSQLTNKVYYKAKNATTLPTEISINSNPFSNYGIIISDEGIGGNPSLEGSNSILDKNKTISDAHIVDLITGYKHHIEYYYNLFGRVITSSKQQSLSSDANLNVSSAELVADEHDRRIIASLKNMGITIEVKEVDPLEKPENENADKEGEGIKNTNGDKVEEKTK